MQEKILLFETLEEKFLRESSEILRKLKSKDTPIELRNAYLETLDGLVTLYEALLPKKYNELINLITLLISEDNLDSVYDSPFLEEALILSSVINQEPNVDLFICLAFNDFEFVCSEFDFPEETIASIVDYLEFAKQGINEFDYMAKLCLPDFPDNINPDFRKYTFTAKQLFKLIVSLSNMPLSDELIVRIIKLIDILPTTHYLVFCSNITLYYSQNEHVLSALIDKTEALNYKYFPTDYFKNQVYLGIISSVLVPDEIVAKIIGCIHLKVNDYYEMFCNLLKEYPKSKIVRDAMIERLEKDRSITSESMMPNLNRLWILAKNT